jgi:geranylgeranyl reductase family protein
MTRLSDVVIVGAGPSGSFLAYLLARRGVHVTVIDKAAFPREKVCGGGLSHKTLQLLPFDVGPLVHRRVPTALLTYQNRDTVVKDLPEAGGAAVVRAEFDAFLIEQAVAAGATFHPSTPFSSLAHTAAGVVVGTPRGDIQARYLIGADGVFSQVRRAAFAPNLVTYVPAVEALVTVAAEEAARIGDRVVFDFGGMPRGYGWIFPKRDHLNVGVYSAHPSRSIKQALAAFMARYAVLRRPVSVQHRGFSIPSRNRRREFERGRVLLVGDAAGLAESFFGEGIYFALKSAALAAEALTSAFDRPGVKAYTALLDRQVLRELTYAGLTARLFFARQRAAFYGLVRNARVNEYFAATISGTLGPRACFYRTLLASPAWPFAARLPPFPGPPL